MKIPTVHLNGTSKDELLKLQLDARSAVQEALRALARATPHGRDFYPQGMGETVLALAEHASRVQRLQSVADELHIIAEGIYNQGR